MQALAVRNEVSEYQPANSILKGLFELGKPLEWLLDPVTFAASIYLLRKDRILHPEGRSKGSSGKWYPAEDEHCACCNSIRAPSCAYPWSLNKHCRSAQHVAARYGIPEKDLKKRAAEITQAFLPKDGDSCYKVMRVIDGKYTSCFDNTTYELGVTMREPARPNHGGGYYCFRTEQAAITHYDSFEAAEKVLMRVRVAGKSVFYGALTDSKIAVSELTPIEELGREVTKKRIARAQ